MKSCRDCKQLKELDAFHKHPGCKQGVRPECKSCTAEFKHKLYLDNKPEVLASTAAWARANPKARKAIQSKFYKTHQTKEQARSNRYAKLNPLVKRAQCARRRATQLQATPKWLTPEQLQAIQQIYLNCPKGHEVDHDAPLKGKSICGLHVPWNLKYLTISENRSKSNKV